MSTDNGSDDGYEWRVTLPKPDPASRPSCAEHGDTMSPITAQGDRTPEPTGYWQCLRCQERFVAVLDGLSDANR
jgi:hypothetical protein